MKITEWMMAKYQTATQEQRKAFAILTAQYVDSFQTIADEMIDEVNVAIDADEAQAALTRFVARCNAKAENLHQSLMTLSGKPGSSWPTKQ